MNFNDIINQLANNPEVLEQTGGRRDVLKGIGSKLAIAALPFAAGSLFPAKAHAQSKETINNVLNYILRNELIVEKIFTDALAVTDLAPKQFRSQFEMMMTHNKAHIATLKQLMDELGGTPVTINPDKIDYSGDRGKGGGQFRDAMSVTEDFLLLMQVLTETMTRIYKGQIYEVLSDKIVVRGLSCIHSVKARQAAFIRFMRTFWIRDNVKPWITGTNSDSPNPAVQLAYSGEGNTIHAGIEIVRINGYDINYDHATQAFDEAYNKQESDIVMNRFVNPF